MSVLGQIPSLTFCWRLEQRPCRSKSGRFATKRAVLNVSTTALPPSFEPAPPSTWLRQRDRSIAPIVGKHPLFTIRTSPRRSRVLPLDHFQKLMSAVGPSSGPTSPSVKGQSWARSILIRIRFGSCRSYLLSSAAALSYQARSTEKILVLLAVFGLLRRHFLLNVRLRFSRLPILLPHPVGGFWLVLCRVRNQFNLFLSDPVFAEQRTVNLSYVQAGPANCRSLISSTKARNIPCHARRPSAPAIRRPSRFSPVPPRHRNPNLVRRDLRQVFR